MYIAMFFTDLSLFYLLPLILFVVLYTLIAVSLLYPAPRTFSDDFSRNDGDKQQRNQVEQNRTKETTLKFC